MAGSDSFKLDQNIKNAFLNFKKTLTFSKEQQAKFSRMLSIFDTNGDNKIDSGELKNIWTQVEKFAGSDKILSVSEADNCVMDSAKGTDWWGALFTREKVTSKELFEFLNVLTTKIKPDTKKEIKSIYQKLGLQSKGLNFEVFEMAMNGYNNLSKIGKTNGMLGIFDTSQSEDKERYYLIDLKNMKLVQRSVMKTGKNDMGDVKKANQIGSNTTLSGFERVGVMTNNGLEYDYYSRKMKRRAVRLEGLEPGINDNAYNKGAVAHYAAGKDTLGCKGFPPVMYGGKIDIEATNKRMYALFPQGAIIYTHPKDPNYKRYSRLVN